jgi:hypothetical protein
MTLKRFLLPARMIATAWAVAFASLATFSPPAAAAPGVETITTCGASVFSPYTQPGLADQIFCPPGTNIPPGMSIFPAQSKVPAGTRASWRADAPSGLTIVAVVIPTNDLYSIEVNDGNGWGGGFYWQGGSAQSSDTIRSFGTFLNSHYFGFQIVCGWSICDGPNHPAQITVESINLYAQETQGPWLAAPDGLWQATGWARGSWPLHFYGDSPSGLCSLSASLNGQPVSGADSSSLQNTTVWHQCAAPGVDPTVSTWLYGQGPIPLTLNASDAAGVPVSYSKTVNIDNSTPSVSFLGPSDAPSTAGTQYVTASASGSPSGIEGLACSVDGASSRWYGGSSAQVAVSGIGEHTVRCAAANNAVDSAGNHGWSAWQSWTMKIGVPTVTGIAFERIVNALRCQQASERVRVPTRWVTVRRHNKFVRVRKPARTKIVKVTRCHPRTAWRRITIWVTVTRHGRPFRVMRRKRVRIVLPPHAVNGGTRRVAYGQGTTVNGWLGTSSGVAIAGQTVTVLTAPDNGQVLFTPITVVTTAADGSWSAQLPAGPSRLVEAVYNGTSSTESSVSGQAHLIIPARVKLVSVAPRRVAWGGTIRIVGQLLGGYLPPGGALVRLRIGFGASYTTYGVQEHVTGNGRFSTTYTFGVGDPSIYRAYWFQIASLPMGNYPYAPAASRRVAVTVGGHPKRLVGAHANFQFDG